MIIYCYASLSSFLIKLTVEIKPYCFSIHCTPAAKNNLYKTIFLMPYNALEACSLIGGIITFRQLFSINFIIRFTKFQQPERDSFYDANDRIVFAKNNAPTGVGFDRKE